MIFKSHCLVKSALASLIAVYFGLSGSDAIALALGRVTVQSALGEPLRAEIDVPDINAEEAASLKTSVALPEAFRAAGLEYNPALAGLQLSLQRRSDGRAFIRLISDKPVTEPFVDLILEASWSTGRIVRDYTVLLDPPSLRAVVNVAPASPQVSVASVTPAAGQGTVPIVTPPASRPALVARKSPGMGASEATASSRKDGDNRITVRPGDTASKIAASAKPAQVSLDQMLVALLQVNANAFVNGNLNRLKAGTVLDIPTEEQARAISGQEAAQIVIAQSRDFNDFRHKLATSAPGLSVDAPDRKSGGAIQAQVDDKKSAERKTSKLELSKGAMLAKAAEEKVALDKIAKDDAKRAAELAKNIKDLNSIRVASVTPAPIPATTPTSPPVSPPASAPATATVPAVLPAALPSSAPSVPSVTVPVAPPAASKPMPAVAPATAPRVGALEEPTLVDQLLNNPLLLLVAGILVALLAGLGVYKARQRKKTAEVDSAFLESRLQPDSFFGASGGQRVDTNDGAATGSSMVYSPSQLDAADDVDPVAEADVYLAYGRDLQAEEILKEALRTHSGRLAVHQKLLDIYAKRRDSKAFEAMANEAFKLTGGQSQDWARICEQGLSIDSGNPLYQPGGEPSLQGTPRGQPALDFATGALATASSTQKLDAVSAPASMSGAVDLDLDLDFSLDEEPSSSIVEARPSSVEPTVVMSAVPSGPAPLDMDFGVTTQSLSAPLAGAPPQAALVEFALPELSLANDTLTLSTNETEDFRQQAEVSFGSTNPSPLATTHSPLSPSATTDSPLPDVNFSYTIPTPLSTSEPRQHAPAAADSGMLEFDLGTLSLDLEPIGELPAGQPAAEIDDPLATKLALAEEFVSIGDDDGARALIEEVIAEATGDLKTKAQRALSSLG